MRSGFGFANKSLIVPMFAGTSLITGLIAYPFEYHPNQNDLRERLIARGKVFQAHEGHHYKLYEGIGFDRRYDSVNEIVWNEKAFESLVLPSDQKELILAFAESQIKHVQVFDDVIKGKGKGIIMLLGGPPRVGKTLTAESVAGTIRVPLYILSARDLGTSSSYVEERLSEILALVARWHAVLLLDEADVYLEARSTHDLERNQLVSIVRILEYYGGFLFLTSNRVDNIDGAFGSRIHLSLQYEELGPSSRYQIWKIFLSVSSSKTGYFSEENPQALSDIPMNGRQIKNFIKTAQLLASSKGKPVSFENVEVVTRLKAANARSKPESAYK